MFSKSDKVATTFAAGLRITNRALLINGTHPYMTKDLVWVMQFVTGLFIIIWPINITIIYSAYLSLMEGDVTEACRLGTMIIVSFVITFKYAILLIHENDTRDMMQRMERDYAHAQTLSAQERRVVREYVDRGAWVSLFWLFIAGGTSALFPTMAIVLMIYTKLTGAFRQYMVFEVIFLIGEESKWNAPNFIVIFIMMSLFAGYVAIMYLAFDPLVPIFMLHECGQLELVKIKISELFREGEEATADIQIKVNRIVEHLQEIYRFSYVTQSNFTIVYEIVLKSATILTPITAYHILESLKRGEPSVEFITFCFGCMMHFYIPCYYSDMLMSTSLSVVEAIYSCGWESHLDLVSTRRTLGIIMLRASRPLAMTTAFTIINLDSFTEMCRQSYAIFNLVNAGMD